MSQGGRDQVVYSLLRVRDASLARELWIRLEEGETTFAEAASQYSQGPEAARKGVMGPLAIGTLQPKEIRDRLRALAPGELTPPWTIGEWHIIIRLEQLTPARFDEATRQTLLDEEMNNFLTSRVKASLLGEALDPLHFDPDA